MSSQDLYASQTQTSRPPNQGDLSQALSQEIPFDIQPQATTPSNATPMRDMDEDMRDPSPAPGETLARDKVSLNQSQQNNVSPILGKAGRPNGGQ